MTTQPTHHLPRVQPQTHANKADEADEVQAEAEDETGTEQDAEEGADTEIAHRTGRLLKETPLT